MRPTTYRQGGPKLVARGIWGGATRRRKFGVDAVKVESEGCRCGSPWSHRRMDALVYVDFRKGVAMHGRTRVELHERQAQRARTRAEEWLQESCQRMLALAQYSYCRKARWGKRRLTLKYVGQAGGGGFRLFVSGTVHNHAGSRSMRGAVAV